MSELEGLREALAGETSTDFGVIATQGRRVGAELGLIAHPSTVIRA